MAMAAGAEVEQQAVVIVVMDFPHPIWVGAGSAVELVMDFPHPIWVGAGSAVGLEMASELPTWVGVGLEIIVAMLVVVLPNRGLVKWHSSGWA